MRDEKGLGGYGIKGLRKNLLTPRAPRTRKMFRHYAECRNEGLRKSWYLSEDFTTLCQMSK